MAIVDLGKITFVNKGAWNKATNYEIKDIISYNGSSWASLKNGNIGNEPKEGVNWTLMVKSTYQAWLEQGNQGTEEEFLNSMAHIQANWEQADKGAKDYIKINPTSLNPRNIVIQRHKSWISLHQYPQMEEMRKQSMGIP